MEILHDATLIARGEICGCVRCRQAVTDIPLKVNPRESIIKKKLLRLQFYQKKFSRHLVRGPNGEWIEK